MSNRTLYPLLLVIVIAAGVAGYGFAGLDDEKHTDAAVADALAAVTPVPTPEPTPIPTPLIVTVAPPECVDAIDMMTEQDLPDLQFIIDVLDAYLDHPSENLADFGQRVSELMLALEPISEADIDERVRLVAACRAAL